MVDEVGELNIEMWWEVDAADEADGLSSSICLIFCSILRRRWLSEVSLARAFCTSVVTFFAMMAVIISAPIVHSLSNNIFVFLPKLVCFCAFLPDDIMADASFLRSPFSYL